MSIEEYAEQFITSSDRRLIDTIDHPTDSDPNAVAAAQQELERRGLSEAQLTEIRSELDGKEKIRSNRNTKLDLLAQQTTATAKELGQTFIVDPDQSRMERRQLRIMMIALGVMLIPITPRYLELPYMLDGRLDLSVVDYCFPLFLLPVAILLLWKKNRVGWFLGAAMSAYGVARSVISGWFDWRRQTTGDWALDSLSPTHAHGQIIGSVLFAASVAFVFNVRRSTTIFEVTERERWFTILPFAALVWWMWT